MKNIELHCDKDPCNMAKENDAMNMNDKRTNIMRRVVKQPGLLRNIVGARFRNM